MREYQTLSEIRGKYCPNCNLNWTTCSCKLSDIETLLESLRNIKMIIPKKRDIFPELIPSEVVIVRPIYPITHPKMDIKYGE